jgi:hypothetical protein
MAMRPVLEFEGDAPQHAHILFNQGFRLAAKLPESQTHSLRSRRQPAPASAPKLSPHPDLTRTPDPRDGANFSARPVRDGALFTPAAFALNDPEIAPAFMDPDAPDFCQCFHESRIVLRVRVVISEGLRTKVLRRTAPQSRGRNCGCASHCGVFAREGAP